MPSETNKRDVYIKLWTGAGGVEVAYFPCAQTASEYKSTPQRRLEQHHRAVSLAHSHLLA